MGRLYCIIVLTVLLGCLLSGTNSKESHRIVRLNATGALNELISSNFPSPYPIYEKFMYILTAEDSHNGIAIQFSDFQLENSKNCEADSLKLYKARYEFRFLVKTYCGYKRPSNIFIPENNVTLVFTTNSNHQKRGFRIKYYATRQDPFPKPKSKSTSKNEKGCDDGIPIGVAIGLGICGFLFLCCVCQKKAEETKKAEAKKKAETEAKKKAETEAKKKAETEAKKKAETEAQQKAETEAKKKAEEEQKTETESKQREKTKKEKLKTLNRAEKPNSETVDEAYQPMNQSTQTMNHPLQAIHPSAYSHSVIPVGQPVQPMTQSVPPLNDPGQSISQHIPPNALQSQTQPLFYPIEMLYPPIQSQGEHPHPIHCVQPAPNNSSFPLNAGAPGGAGIHGYRKEQPPSYEALTFDYNIPETKLL